MAQTPAIGRSLELYYVDGDPDGLITARTFNWTGQVLVVPRTRLAEGLKREEAGCAGVYFLLGERDGEPLAYIGESEAVGIRLRDHDLKKDWWSSVVFVTTAANELNKAHVKYLEARLVEEARALKLTPLDNDRAPNRPSLSEADRGKMEAFLQSLMLVLPAVRVDMFVQRSRPQAKVPSPAIVAAAGVDAFDLESRKHGIQASALLTAGEFVVQAGSTTRAAWEGTTTAESGYAKLHRELIRSGVIKLGPDDAVFAQAYAFKSPSAAAAVILGRPANGAIEWRTASGLTYKEWEKQRLAG